MSQFAHHESMLFALLKSALNDIEINQLLFTNATDGDWRACYALATKQGVGAIAWDGVRKLPAELQPERTLRITWAINTERQEQRYEKHCEVLNELQAFYAEHKIGIVQMKGVGFGTYYPINSHREGGDIDIYTYSLDTNCLTHKEANGLADRLMSDMGIHISSDKTEKHSEFHYKGVMIENHKTFINVEIFRAAKFVEELLHKNLNPQITELCGGKYKVLTPSPEFNTLFLSFHAAQHFGTGLALHHLCDWFCLLKRCGLKLPDNVNDQYREFVHALTHLCNELLGSEVAVNADTKIADTIINEILHPQYGSALPETGRLGVLKYKAKRFLHKSRLLKIALGHSMLQAVCHSVVSHIKRPYTIFH